MQLRIVLDTIGQAERDISMLHTAVEQSLRILRRAVRTGDTTALVSTRALIEQANRRLNVRREPLLSPNINTLTRP